MTQYLTFSDITLTFFDGQDLEKRRVDIVLRTVKLPMSKRTQYYGILCEPLKYIHI